MRAGFSFQAIEPFFLGAFEAVFHGDLISGLTVRAVLTCRALITFIALIALIAFVSLVAFFTLNGFQPFFIGERLFARRLGVDHVGVVNLFLFRLGGIVAARRERCAERRRDADDSQCFEQFFHVDYFLLNLILSSIIALPPPRLSSILLNIF